MFKDDYTVFESAMFNAFNATVQQTLDTKKFLHSEDIRAQYLKNEILYSVRLAMHISMDKFIMADFDIEKGDELAVSEKSRSALLNKLYTNVLLMI